MSRFGLVGPSYRSQSVNADNQICMNLYCEQIESQQGKGAMALYQRPGLKLAYTLGTAGGRGIITAQGRTFAVAGATLFELLANGTAVARAVITSNGQTVSMCNGQTQLLLASAGIGYCLDLPTNALTNLTAALGAPPVSQVGYADGFFFALFSNSNKVQSSDLQNALSWPGINFTGVSVFSDNIVGMFFDHREMWLWGPRAAQPYFDSGNFPFPYDVVQGGFIESGLAAQFSPAKADNSIFWLEADDRGNCIVRRANGYTPQRVSTHALEYEFSQYATISDAVGYSYKDQGHEFYVLTFPAADKQWAYDTATGMWAERGYWNSQAGVFTRHRAQYHTFNFGKHLVMDPTTGAVYEQSINFYDDFGNPLRRVRRAPHISNEQSWMRHKQLQVDVEVGLGSFQGSGVPGRIHLADSSNVAWQVGINDAEQFVPIHDTSGIPAAALFLNDPVSATSWQITISTLGAIFPVQVAYRANYSPTLKLVSTSGLKNFVMRVQSLGSGIGQLLVGSNGQVTRGPLMMLRYSNDSGKTWVTREDADCGQPGEYTKRVIWRRLGRARDRIYEISMTDPVPWRIIDAYLDATGMGPQKRFAHEARERA